MQYRPRLQRLVKRAEVPRGSTAIRVYDVLDTSMLAMLGPPLDILPPARGPSEIPEVEMEFLRVPSDLGVDDSRLLLVLLQGDLNPLAIRLVIEVRDSLWGFMGVRQEVPTVGELLGLDLDEGLPL